MARAVSARCLTLSTAVTLPAPALQQQRQGTCTYHHKFSLLYVLASACRETAVTAKQLLNTVHSTQQSRVNMAALLSCKSVRMAGRTAAARRMLPAVGGRFMQLVPQRQAPCRRLSSAARVIQNPGQNGGQAGGLEEAWTAPPCISSRSRSHCCAER
jgi:hypothetical protein